MKVGIIDLIIKEYALIKFATRAPSPSCLTQNNSDIPIFKIVEMYYILIHPLIASKQCQCNERNEMISTDKEIL